LRKKCCSSGTPAPLLLLAKNDKSCKTAATKVFNQFLLSKYQNSKTLNDVNFADQKLIKGMGKEAVRMTIV
jgi:hypothetical protein